MSRRNITIAMLAALLAFKSSYSWKPDPPPIVVASWVPPSKSAADLQADAPGDFPEKGGPWERLGRYLPATVTPSPDILENALKLVGNEFVPRDSSWQAADRKLFSRLLARHEVHTLVVPAQVQGFGTDRISRSLWTGELGYALAKAGVRVADPFLVMRALGDGERTLPQNRVDALAMALHSKRVVESYIGHDRHHHLTVLVRVYDKHDAAQSILSIQPRVSSWSSIEFSDEDPPLLALQRLVAELTRQLTGQSGQTMPPVSVRSTKRASLTIQSDPAALVKRSTPSPEAPLTFALLGALTPSDAPLARERLYEKVLISLNGAQLPDDQDQFFRALALFKLELRPAALATLRSAPGSPAVEALRAIVNGNLTGTDALIARVTGLEHLLLAIELNDLRITYSVGKGPVAAAPWDPAVAAMAGRGLIWNVLIGRRINDLNRWDVSSNFQLKRVLDSLFPLDWSRPNDVVAESQTIGNPEPSGIEFELAAPRHVRALVAGRADAWSRSRLSSIPTSWDLLDVIEADAEANLLKSVQHMLNERGQPQEALAYLDQLESYFGGHPDFAALRAVANSQLSKAVRSDLRPRFAQAAKEASLLSIFWAQGQNKRTPQVLAEDSGGPVAFDLATAYSYDFPGRPFWLRESTYFFGTDAAQLARAADALNYTQSSLDPIFALMASGKPRFQQLAQLSLETRFVGNPDADHLRAPRSAAPQTRDQMRQSLREAIRMDPSNWQHYLDLGSILIVDDGDYSGAEKVFESYPPFGAADLNNETVTLSNYAYDAARLMYWRGQAEPARRLYELAARFSNGSEAALTAAQRLKTMQGDFSAALEIAAERAGRYQDGYAHRDLITLLYALNQRKRAAAEFEAVAQNPEGSAAWQAALIGQRMNGLRDPDVAPWIERHINQSDDSRIFRYGATLLLLWNSTDRMPPRDLAEQVRRIAHDPIGSADSGKLASYPAPDDPTSFIVISPSSFRKDARKALADGTPLDSDLTLFARGYVALRYRNFASAVTLFDALAAHYSIESYVENNGSAPYALGYFAYASSKTGDPLRLESFLDSLPQNSLGFDHYLAKAFFAASHHAPDQALRFLKDAYNRMPWTEDRPVFVDLQFAEACEWLSESLGDRRFQEIQLDFARGFAVVNPFQAWPYAVIAQATHEPAARTKALGMAMYLDPQSTRLRRFPQVELDVARKWAQDANPFGTPPGNIVKVCCSASTGTPIPRNSSGSLYGPMVVRAANQ